MPGGWKTPQPYQPYRAERVNSERVSAIVTRSFALRVQTPTSTRPLTITICQTGGHRPDAYDYHLSGRAAGVPLRCAADRQRRSRFAAIAAPAARTAVRARNHATWLAGCGAATLRALRLHIISARHVCPSRVPVTCARLAPPSASHVCPSCASDYNEPARPQRYSTIEHHGGARQRYATATKVALRDQGSTSPQMPLSCTFGPNVAPLSGAGPRSARRSLITRFDHEV